MRPSCLAIAFLLLASSSPAWTADATVTLRLCIGDVDYPPYTLRNGQGTLQILADKVAASVNMRIAWHRQPVRRCNENIRTGAMDAMITAIYPEMSPDFAYPEQNGQPDRSLALVNANFVVYRRPGSPLTWDGERMNGIGTGAVGVYSGFSVLSDKLKQLGIRYDDGAKSLEVNLDKLVRGRLEAVIALEQESLGQYAGSVEALPAPFVTLDAYMAFSKAFYARHPELAQSYWRAIRKQKPPSAPSAI